MTNSIYIYAISSSLHLVEAVNVDPVGQWLVYSSGISSPNVGSETRMSPISYLLHSSVRAGGSMNGHDRVLLSSTRTWLGGFPGGHCFKYKTSKCTSAVIPTDRSILNSATCVRTVRAFFIISRAIDCWLVTPLDASRGSTRPYYLQA